MIPSPAPLVLWQQWCRDRLVLIGRDNPSQGISTGVYSISDLNPGVLRAVSRMRNLVRRSLCFTTWSTLGPRDRNSPPLSASTTTLTPPDEAPSLRCQLLWSVVSCGRSEVLKTGDRSRGPWDSDPARRGLARACQTTPFASVSWNDTDPFPSATISLSSTADSVPVVHWWSIVNGLRRRVE